MKNIDRLCLMGLIVIAGYCFWHEYELYAEPEVTTVTGTIECPVDGGDCEWFVDDGTGPASSQSSLELTVEVLP